jgi:hypothetical protein
MPARHRVLSLFVLLAACRPERPLSEVPITGGTQQERAIVKAELEVFARAVGPDRIGLRRVKLVEEVRGDDRLAGAYTGSEILLDAGWEDLASTVRHELCHAVERAEGLAAGPDPLLDELAAGFFQEMAVLADLWPKYYRTARLQRSEALASFCELGPVALDSLRQPCPGQSPLLQEVAEWMMDRIYLEHPLLPPLELETSDAVTMDAWVETFDPRISATAQPGVVVAEGDWDEHDWRRGLDLYTGEVQDYALDAEPNVQELPWAGGFDLYGGVGWREGPAVLRGYVSAHHLNSGSSRSLVYDPDEGGWRTVLESCEPRFDVFTADGQLWMAWEEGPLLRWRPLLP